MRMANFAHQIGQKHHPAAQDAHQQKLIFAKIIFADFFTHLFDAAVQILF
jgi:hypothetical protein